MKKVLLVVVLAVLMTVSSVFAQDLGIQIIGGPAIDIESEPISLDDLQIDASYRLDEYAILYVLSFDFYDSFAQYNKDNSGNNYAGWTGGDNPSNVHLDKSGDYFKYAGWKDSGTGADFAFLLIDLVNLQKKDYNFFDDISVKVIYDDEYEFGGWVRQFNQDYQQTVNRKAYSGKFFAGGVAIDPANEEPIGQMYRGSYAIGCTLPNYVVEGKEPLRMEITLGDNELTYHIRK